MKNIIEKIKKNLLIKTATTIALIVVLISLFVLLTIWLNNLQLDPIDLTAGKLYTLTDISKERVKDIDKDVNIYFIGYSEGDETLNLARQYHNANEKINIETVISNERPDLVTKYSISEDSTGVIVESGEKFKVLTSGDFYTYDQTTYEQINITEEKLTNAILYVTSEKIPKVYFLEGYSELSISTNMTYLAGYLGNEVTEYETLNLVLAGKVPEDCDTLIIMTPQKDFDDIATNAIIDYINNGGNLLWFNALIAEEADMPNVNKILSMYGIKPFELGYINEEDPTKMMTGAPYIIIPTVNYSTITKNIAQVLMLNATKLNFVSDEELNDLKVTKTELLKTSNSSYFRTDFTLTSNNRQESEEQNSFIIGAELDKVISEKTEEQSEKTSKLVIYGENLFITDYPLPLSQTSQVPVITCFYNKDLAMDSIAYLVDREEDIVIRKDTNTATYTATETQNRIIMTIIFGVPILIIIIGIIVWQVRRRKK